MLTTAKLILFLTKLHHLLKIKNRNIKIKNEKMTNSIVFGIHAVSALLHEHPDSALHLFVQKGKEDKNIKIILSSAKKNGILAELVDKAFLDKLSNDGNHQGVIIKKAATKIYRENELNSFIESIHSTACFLVLDCVQDPHNLGACIRSA